MLSQEELNEENKHLSVCLDVLQSEIEKADKQVKSLSDNIQQEMTYAWDKTNRLSDTEFVYALANIQKRSVYAENANKKVNSYKKMLNNTYFARIDFEDSFGITKVYIGIASLENNGDFLVYDWRAPISSMFYNSDLGDASFEISTGEKVKGKLLLKRQYKIQDGKIKEIFDTDTQIIDNVLKYILSQNSNNKMKNIVSTIQKEQNEIIRKNDRDILVVQGPAGSGKTSIALHKIAYLLYSMKDKINNSNVMIISPNEIFNNYISDVLPEIGEDNVARSTFLEFAKIYINEFSFSTKLEDVYEIIYSSKKRNFGSKYDEIRFKNSQIFYKMLDDYIEINKQKLLEIEEILIDDKQILSQEEVDKIVQDFELFPESLYLNGKRIVEKVYTEATKKTVKMNSLEKLKKQAIDNLSKIKIKVQSAYVKLFSDKNYFLNFAKSEFKKYSVDESYDLETIFENTKTNLLNGKLEYQDITPFMYFKSKLIGIAPNKHIKYVFIDEAQDYTLAQFKILAMLFKNSNITLLGDLNQGILPFNSYKNYDSIIKTLKSYKPQATSEVVELNRTYRSSYEINEFSKQVIQGLNFNQIDRHADPVLTKRQEKFDANEILNEAIKLKNSYNTVAIICKNVEEELLYKKKLENSNNKSLFRIITKNDNVFVENNIMIIPSYLSKGLEFDAVIVSNVGAEFYDETEKNLLYVVLTRALHKLEIFWTGKLTPLLSKENL